MALETGIVPLGNPEAIQFHPTGIVPTNILVTEGCRGDGGTLLDVDQKRFMPDKYEPEKAELASRDVVSALDDASHSTRDTASRALMAITCGWISATWGKNISRPNCARWKKSATTFWVWIPSPN